VAALLEDKVEVIEAEALPDSRLTSGTLADIDLPRGVLIAALQRGHQLQLVRGQDRVQPGDQVLIITTTAKAAKLDEYLTAR
jgi:Trk K+ transport system NAD-binding subunit